MISSFTEYQVEIKNLKYITDEGKKFPKTAIIRYKIPEDTKEQVELMGYMEQEEVFELIDKKEKIDLSNCYIDKISLSEYRQSRNLDPKSFVELFDFKAASCFFDSAFPIDFSYVNFQGESTSFEGSVFAKGIVNLNNSECHTKVFNYSYTFLKNGIFNCANARFHETEILFKNTTFGTGKKDFQYTDFGVGFKNFTNTEFGEGDVSFINTIFNDGNVSFKVSRFGTGRVDFHFAKFGAGDISFERTEFGDGGIDFRTVEFGNGRVNFNRCIAGAGEITFEGCDQNSGKFSFKRAKLGDGELSFELVEMQTIDVNFDRTNFGRNTISFYNAKFKNLSFQQCHFDHYTDLRVKYCEVIDLSNTIVRDIIDLKPYEFEEEIKIIHFGGMRLIGRIYIDWHKNRVYHLIKDQQESSMLLKAEQFRTLKENFNVCGQYNDEDLAYLQFKRYEARHELETELKKNPLRALWAYPAHLFKLIIFDRIGHYATNPGRVILSMIVALTFFSLVYSVLILTHVGDIIESVTHIHVLNAVGKGFYHSAITFFTIGYGDYYPEGIIRWISGLEGFTGVFLMSYFTVAFVRKVLR